MNDFDIKQKISLSDLIKLNKHITENFIDDKNNDHELEINKDIYWVEGFKCAVWSSYNFTKMDDWLPFINGDCVFKSEKHINEIMSLIFRLQNHIVTALNDNSYQPLYENYNINNEDKFELAKRWSKGYMFGSILAHQEFLESEEILEMLSPIVALADDSTKKNLKGKISNEELLSIIPKIANAIAKVMHIMRTENFPEIIDENEGAIRNDSKICRNDMCFCGSGKKYKKCCLVKNSSNQSE